MRRKIILLVAACALFSAAQGCKKEEKVEQKPAEQPAAVATAAPATEFTFEDGAGKWWPAGDVKVEQATDVKHSGNASAKITGKAPAGTWTYAATKRFALQGGSKYKFTGWVKVDSVSDPKFAPLLRVGLFEKDKWLQNAMTRKYDLSKKGQWQMLSTEFTAPANCDKAEISLEKGVQDVAVGTTTYLDDLKVEQVK